MITTVTLNAAIDKTYTVSRFPLGEATRTGKPYVLPGGKGINAARVIGQLGGEALATGFTAGMNGRSIERMLERQGIAHDFAFVEQGGESRLCLTVLDQTTGQTTELIEPGPVIGESDLTALRQKIHQCAARSQIVVFSGSVPEGVPVSIYRELIKIVKRAGCLTILDASGEALIHGLDGIPDLIKPNEHEIAALLGKPLTDVRELGPVMDRLNARGIAYVVVSLGAEGCIAGHEGKLFRVAAPSLQAVNTVGCGDSFVAGLAVSLARGDSVEETLKRAVAAGAADALTPEAGVVDSGTVNRMMKELIVIPL